MGEAADEMRRRGTPGADSPSAPPATPRAEEPSPGGQATGGAEATDATEATEEIRTEIEQTRAEMSETINAIEERLSPQHIKEQAKETIRDATIGRAERTATSAGAAARQAGSRARATLGQLAGRAQRQVGHLGTRAQQQAQRAQGQFQRTLQDKPSTAVALTLAVAAAVGVVLVVLRRPRFRKSRRIVVPSLPI